MTMKVLEAPELKNFVEKLITNYPVYGVRSKSGAEQRFEFAELESPEELRLDYDVTILPPKKYFLPSGFP